MSLSLQNVICCRAADPSKREFHDVKMTKMPEYIAANLIPVVKGHWAVRNICLFGIPNRHLISIWFACLFLNAMGDRPCALTVCPAPFQEDYLKPAVLLCSPHSTFGMASRLVCLTLLVSTLLLSLCPTVIPTDNIFRRIAIDTLILIGVICVRSW